MQPGHRFHFVQQLAPPLLVGCIIPFLHLVQVLVSLTYRHLFLVGHSPVGNILDE